MTDIQKPADTTQAATPVATGDTATAAPAVETTPTTPASAETTTTETAPAEVTAPVAVEVVAPAAESAAPESLLGQAAAPAPEAKEIKPEAETTKDSAPAAEQKNEGSLTDEPAPLPKFEPFTLPEGFTRDEKGFESLTNDLAEFEVKNKLSHAEVQAFGQKLVDKYVSDIKRMQDSQVQEISSIKSGWKEAFQKDPELGGNRIETTKKILGEAINGFSGSPENVKSFGEFVEKTGIGDNPDLIRLIVNQQKAIQNYKTKYESESNVRPLAGTKPDVAALRPAQKLYGKQNNG
jgi:hypothetical protein